MGTGTLTLTSTASTYTGKTTINDGTIAIADEASLGGNPASFTADQLTINGGTLEVTATFTIDDANRGVTLGASNGTFDVDTGITLTVANVVTGAGNLSKTGAGTLILAAENTYVETSIDAGTLQVGDGGTTGTLGSGDVTNDASLIFDRSNSLTVSNTIDGNGTLTQAGTGTTALTGANSYGGITSIIDGTLSISADANLGTAPGSATPGHLVIDGGTLQATASFSLDANRGIALGDASGSGTGAIEVTDANNLSYDGIVADNGTGADSLSKTGTGTLTLGGANSYTGITTISDGILSISADANLGAVPGSATPGNIVLDGGTLQATASFTLNANRGVALGASTGSGSGSIDVTTGENLTYAGVLADNGTGADGLTKTGVGTLTLNGGSTHTGTTTVSDGTLAGSGSLAGPLAVQSGATHAPGIAAAGTFAVANDVAFQSGAFYSIDIDGTSSGQADLLSVTGGIRTVALNGATLNGSLGFAASTGDVGSDITIIENVDPTSTVSGEFDGLIEGANYVVGNAVFQISYVGGTDSNDVVLTITSVIIPPVLANIETTAVGYTENDLATQITNTLTVADVDDTDMESATVAITAGLAATEDVLAADVGATGLLATYSSGVLTLTGTASKSAYETVLRSVTYVNLSESPSTTARTVSFTVNDGDINSNSLTREITITSVNDPPTATNLTQTQNYNEGDASVAIADIVVSDVDTSPVQMITATLTLATPATGVLTTSGTATYDGGTGVWTITDTLANVNAALAAVSFTPATNNDVDTTISTLIRDQDNAGPTAGVITLDVTPVNDAPTATNLTQSLSYNEGDASVAIADIVVSDVDTSPAQTITATLTLANPATGVLTTSGTATYDGGTGEWTITDTLANVNAALAAVSFTPAANNDVDTTISTLIRDQDNAGPTAGVITLDVTPANDAPTATNLTQSLSYNEDDASVAIADIVVSDVDTSPAQTITATLTLANPATGVLTTSGTATYDGGTGVWTITGTLANVNAALAAVSFTPAANNDVDTTISTLIRDQDNAGPTAGVITLDVTPVNDQQSLDTNATLAVNEGATGTITNSLLATSDVDNSADELIYIVSSGPTDGQLELTSDPGIAIAQFTQEDIDNDLVVYVQDGTATTSDSFVFTVDDGEGPSSGGTFNITITLADTEVTLVGGDTLTITDAINGGDSNDALLISHSGSIYTITDTGGLLIDASSIAGSTGSGTATVTIPDASVTGIHFDTLAGNDDVTVDSTDSGVAVTIDGGNDTDTVNWDSTVAIGGLTVTAETINLDSGSVDSGVGNQEYNGAVLIGANATLTAADVTFNGTVDNSTPSSLTINASGDTTFNGVVGGVGELSSIKVNSTGSSVAINAEINVGSGGLDIDPPDTITVIAPINSAGGPVNLEANNGVTLSGAAADVTTGGGTFTVDADSDNDGIGAYSQDNADSAVSTGGGSISISAAAVSLSGSIDVGAGAATVAITSERHISLSSGSSITTADGDLTLNANTAGTAAGNFIGININAATVQTTGAGQVMLEGHGGDDAGGLQHGIRLESGGQVIGGTGLVTVVGNSGDSPGNDNYGVYVDNTDSKISSDGGHVSVTGNGGGTATSSSNIGVFVRTAGEISAGGSGAVEVIGYGGNAAASGSSNNFGVYLDNAGAAITSGGGDVTVTGTGGGGVNSFAVRLAATGTITTAANGGDISVAGDSMDLAGGTLDAGANRVTLKQQTNGSRIDLGGGDVFSGLPRTLGLTDGELDQVTAGVLQIGDNNSGSVSFTSAIDLAGTDTLEIISGSTVNDTGGATVFTDTNLAIVAAAGVGTTSPLNIAVSNFEAYGGSGGVNVANIGDLTIGDVNSSLTGASADNAAITISAASNQIVSESIDSDGGDVSLTATGNLIVDTGVTVFSGVGSLSLAADVTPAGSGDDGAGTLTIRAASNVFGADISLRGADVDIDSTATVGGSSATPVINTFATPSNGELFSIAINSSGDLFLGHNIQLISKVNPAGAVSTFVSGAPLNQPFGVAVDSSDSVYVADRGTLKIRKYDPAGMLLDDNFGSVSINDVRDMAFDSGGNLFLAERSQNKITKVTPGGIASTFVSAGGLSNAYAIAVDSSDNLYVGNHGSNTISKITPGGSINTFISDASINNPVGLAFDGSGNLYVSNQGTGEISKYDAAGTLLDANVATPGYGDLIFDSNGSLLMARYNPGTPQVLEIIPGSVATSQVTIQSSLPAREISLGGGAVSGINLTDAELDRIITTPTGRLTVGDATQTGHVTFSGAVDLAGTDTLEIITAGTVNDTGGATVFTDTNLAIDAGAGVGTTSALNIAVTNFEANGGSGGVHVANTGSLVIGGASTSLIGVSSTAGDISISAADIEISDSVSGSDSLSLTPASTGSSIGIGGGTGDFNIDDADLSNLANGFSSITIGDASSGTVDIDTATFNDPVTIAGGTIHDNAGTDINMAAGDTASLVGNVSPGQSAGVLLVTGDVDLADGDTFTVEIDGTAGAGVVGGHDQLSATGSVDILGTVTLALDRHADVRWRRDLDDHQSHRRHRQLRFSSGGICLFQLPGIGARCQDHLCRW